MFNRLRSIDSPIRARYERIQRVTLIDPFSVEVELKEPYPPFTTMLAAPMAKVIKRVEATDALIGSGPFIPITRKIHASGVRVLELRRNENYHNSPAHIINLELWEVGEAKAKGLVDQGIIHDTALLATMPPHLLSRDSRAIEMVSPAATTWILTLNSAYGVTKSSSARTCLSSLIDRAKFITRFAPHHLPAAGFLPPTLPGYISNLQLRRARNCDMLRGKRIRINYPDWLEHGADMCQFFRDSFAAAGVVGQCIGKSLLNIMKAVSEQSDSLSFLSQTLDLPDVEYFLETFESSSFLNYGNLHDSHFDSLIALARRQADREERNKLYRTINKYLTDNATTINLTYPPLVSYWHRCIEKPFVPLSGEMNIDYRTIRLRQDCENRNDFDAEIK